MTHLHCHVPYAFGALLRRSRPALDGHDDAAAEAEFGTEEFSVTEQTVTHHGQGRPKLLIVMAGEVHVVHGQDAALAKRGYSPAQLEDLPAGRVREYQVKLAEAATTSAPSPDSKRTHGGHADSAVRCTCSSSSTVTTSTSRRAPSPWTSQASPTPTPVPISRTRPRQVPPRPVPPAAADLDLAGELETGSVGSFVRGQNAAGKLLAVGDKEHHAGYREPPPDGLPDPAVVAALSRQRHARPGWLGPAEPVRPLQLAPQAD